MPHRRVRSDDPWGHLRNLTSARVALGRAGASLPTAEVLSFAAAHAAARDAVRAELDVPRLVGDLSALGEPIVTLESQADTLAVFLQRPDLGRRLSEASRATLIALAREQDAADVVFIVSEGLAAPAAQLQAPPLLARLLPRLRTSGVSVGPIVVVRRARVAIEDEVGALLGARAAVILLGERPGLGAPDSLGAYLVFEPALGKTDADRNCVSNIRPAGLPPEAAADTLHHLVTASLARGLSGVHLKDDRRLLEPRDPTASSQKRLQHPLP